MQTELEHDWKQPDPSDLVARIEAMSDDERRGALIALDAVSRPMTVREIEGWLRHKGGVSRMRAVKLAGTLKHVHVIALIGGEDG